MVGSAMASYTYIIERGTDQHRDGIQMAITQNPEAMNGSTNDDTEQLVAHRDDEFEKIAGGFTRCAASDLLQLRAEWRWDDRNCIRGRRPSVMMEFWRPQKNSSPHFPQNWD